MYWIINTILFCRRRTQQSRDRRRRMIPRTSTLSTRGLVSPAVLQQLPPFVHSALSGEWLHEMYCFKRIGILIITALTYLWFFFSWSESKQVKLRVRRVSWVCFCFWSCVWVLVIWYYASVVGRWWMRPLETVY